jgi:hypothetical protein
LTLLIAILKGIKDGLTFSEIAKKQNSSKSLISYHAIRLIQIGYLKEIGRDAFKILELTQPGRNFLDRYGNKSQVRLENIRFKATILKMPHEPLNWKKIDMQHWLQFISQVDGVKVHLNEGKIPTIEFIPSPVDGNDPCKLRDAALISCINAARKLENTIGIKLGELESSSSPEYVVYSPLAKEFARHIGQVRVNGIGKLNASKPLRKGEFEFIDPRDAAVFMSLPQEVRELKDRLDQLEAIIKEALQDQE